jgi:hypothetical protein
MPAADNEGKETSAPSRRRRQRAAVKKRTEKYLPLFQTLQEFKPREKRSILLAHLDDETCEALYEAVANVVKNDSIPIARRKKLRRLLEGHSSSLRYLADFHRSKKKKRKLLPTLGGSALSAVLDASIPLLLDAYRGGPSSSAKK